MSDCGVQPTLIERVRDHLRAWGLFTPSHAILSEVLETMAAKEDTHRQRQDAVIVASVELLSSHPFNEVLSVEEERGLATGLGSLRAWATAAGVIDVPLGQWSRDNIMRFLALAVRSAVPLRSLPDHHAFRTLNDEIPF